MIKGKAIIIGLIVTVLMITIVGCKENIEEITLENITELDEEAVIGDMEEDEISGAFYMDDSLSTQVRVENLMSFMTVEEKAGQMIQAEQGQLTSSEMTALGLGSVLSGGGSVPGDNSVAAWQGLIAELQEAALSTRLSIPMIYGIDAIHGHSNVLGATIFPHNIGLGAANNPDLMYEMGQVVADEMKMTNIRFNFSPCVAVSSEPRWGRTYESFSSDPEIVTSLSVAYLEGQLDAGIVATGKHYAGDGGVTYGTGDGGNLIDRGDTIMSQEAFMATHIPPYVELIETGVDVIMVSFSRFNGLHMHEHTYLVTDVLKGALGFEGFVISDWDAIAALPYDTLDERVAASINAGIDMLMQPYDYKEVHAAIVRNIGTGAISQERMDDAVRRILTVKMDAGLFEDPYGDEIGIVATELGSAGYRELAQTLVSESLVLLKNETGVLPLKEGSKVFVYGPAADDIGAQCGGWTRTWQGSTDVSQGGAWMEGTTILDGLLAYQESLNIEFITDIDRIDEADTMILVIGEIPYAEMNGDTIDLSLTGEMGLPGNQEAIELAKNFEGSVLTLLVAGRHIMINEYMEDWDSVVMCYLPGTEGGGIADVITGQVAFSGKLPMPWYFDVSDIGTENPRLLFDIGYGLTLE